MSAPERLCAACGRDISHRGKNAIYCTGTCKHNASEERRKERREQEPTVTAGPLLPPTHCIPCGKLACQTEGAARFAKHAVEEGNGRTNEVRYYQCPEGFWHWTRMYVWGDR